MRIETLLNYCHPLKSFVYTKCRLEIRNVRPALVAVIKPRKNGKVYCSVCGNACRCYDHLDTREFDFVPLWNIPVRLEYPMRRVHCPECGVRVERVPWADGKSHTTKTFELFLAQWARKLSWKETATSFGTCWDTVYRSVKAVVAYGLAHRNLDCHRAFKMYHLWAVQSVPPQRPHKSPFFSWLSTGGSDGFAVLLRSR